MTRRRWRASGRIDHEAFDDAVLQRVERHHDQAPGWRQQSARPAPVPARSRRVHRSPGCAGLESCGSPGRCPIGIDPATRSFQALRRVNDELGEIERALEQAVRLLAPAGRLIVVCFPSAGGPHRQTLHVDAAGRTPSPSRHDPRGLAARPHRASACSPPGRCAPAPVRPMPTRALAAPGCAHRNARWRGVRHRSARSTCICSCLPAVPGCGHSTGQAWRADNRSRDREGRSRHRGIGASRPGCCTPNGRCQSDPQRLQALSDQLLNLKTVTPGQFTSMSRSRQPATRGAWAGCSSHLSR